MHQVDVVGVRRGSITVGGENDLTVRGQIMLRVIGGGFTDSFSQQIK